jgi:hypothetical protein
MIKQRAGGNGAGLPTYDDEDLGDCGRPSGGLRLVGLRRRHGQIGAGSLAGGARFSSLLFLFCE